LGERYIKRLAYAVGKTIETDVISVMSAKANADTATLGDSVWATSGTIDEDIIAMQAGFYDDSLPDVLTAMVYEAVNFMELKKYMNHITGPMGFSDANQFDFLGTTHYYGGNGMSHGTAYGFDQSNPPVVVAYGTEAGAFNPSVLAGMEGYAPSINVKVKQIDDEIPRRTEIYMAAKYAVVCEEPNALLKQTGL
jgi:hypothetical protein